MKERKNERKEECKKEGMKERKRKKECVISRTFLCVTQDFLEPLVVMMFSLVPVFPLFGHVWTMFLNILFHLLWIHIVHVVQVIDVPSCTV